MEHLDSLIDATLDFSRLIRRKMAGHARGADSVNMLQLHGLALIHEHDGMTMRELADLLKITPSTASVFVGRLVKSGCVRRKADAANRTFVRLHLTERGVTILRASTRQKQDVLRDVFSVIPAQDRENMRRIFTALVQSVSDHSSR